MNDKEETTRKFDDQPEWVKYLISRVDALTTEVSQLRERLDARDRETKPPNETLEAFRVEIHELPKGRRVCAKGRRVCAKGRRVCAKGNKSCVKGKRVCAKSKRS